MEINDLKFPIHFTIHFPYLIDKNKVSLDILVSTCLVKWTIVLLTRTPLEDIFGINQGLRFI